MRHFHHTGGYTQAFIGLYDPEGKQILATPDSTFILHDDFDDQEIQAFPGLEEIDAPAPAGVPASPVRTLPPSGSGTTSDLPGEGGAPPAPAE